MPEPQSVPPPGARAIRAALRLSQQEFAESFGISLSTLRDWEQNRRTPEGPAQTLLTVIAANPAAVRSALKRSTPVVAKRSVNARNGAKQPLDAFTAHWASEYPDLNVAELEFKAAIALIGTVIESEFRVLARSMLKISEGELRVLLTLRRTSKHALQPSALFRNLLVTSSAGTKQIQRLEKRRMIQKISSRTGKRFLIGLTTKGDRIVDAAFARSPAAFLISDAAFESLAPADQASGINFLRQLLVAIGSRQPRTRAGRRQLG